MRLRAALMIISQHDQYFMIFPLKMNRQFSLRRHNVGLYSIHLPWEYYVKIERALVYEPGL